MGEVTYEGVLGNNIPEPMNSTTHPHNLTERIAALLQM